MNKLNTNENWSGVEDKFRYANLTDDDLLFEEGKEEEFFGRLQEKLGESKVEKRNYFNKILQK